MTTNLHHQPWLTMLRYSIDAYMNCVDACYQTLKHKMNGRRFAAGGGCRQDP